MAGPVASMMDVPLGEVLPPEFSGAEVDLRRLANEIDGHPRAAGRAAWHWYPRPTLSAPYLLLADTAITLYNTRVDWLELALDIAWMAPAQLTVNAAVEVGCWCPTDHNMHQVRAAQWPVTDGRDLIEAFAAGTAMLTSVLDSGPFEPGPWRVEAGLPDEPARP